MKTIAKAIATAVVIGVMITLFIGCGSADQAGSPQPASPAAQTDQAGATQAVQDSPSGDAATTADHSEQPQLEIDNGVVVIGMYATAGRNYNDPIGLHVEPGTTVRFVNRSGMHSATAYHPDNGRDRRIPDGANSWDSGLLTRRDASFEITLTVEGVYDYFCIPHEAMGHVGRIVVGDPDAFPAQPADGLPQAVRNALPSVDRIMAEHVVRP